MSRLAAFLFAALVLAAIGQALWQHAHLPAVVASHFRADGSANGWMSREAFLGLRLGLVLLLAVLLEGIARLNPRLPDEYVNIPHREHWLAPERRAATHAWLAALLRLTGGGVLLLFLALFHQVYRANLAPGPLSDSTAVILLAAPLGVVALLAACFLRFPRPPA